MKTILLTIPVCILICIMLPFFVVGFIWRPIKDAFYAGAELSDKFGDYLDKN